MHSVISGSGVSRKCFHHGDLFLFVGIEGNSITLGARGSLEVFFCFDLLCLYLVFSLVFVFVPTSLSNTNSQSELLASPTILSIETTKSEKYVKNNVTTVATFEFLIIKQTNEQPN